MASSTNPKAIHLIKRTRMAEESSVSKKDESPNSWGWDARLNDIKREIPPAKFPTLKKIAHTSEVAYNSPGNCNRSLLEKTGGAHIVREYVDANGNTTLVRSELQETPKGSIEFVTPDQTSGVQDDDQPPILTFRFQDSP